MKLISIAYLIAIILLAESCWATCSINTTNGLTYYTFNVSGVNPPSFNPASFTIGQTIYKASGTVTVTNYQSISTAIDPPVSCTESTWSWTVAPLWPAVNGIFPTSIAGIGMKISSTSGVWPLSFGAVKSFSGTYSITVELIKTGQVTENGTLSSLLGEYRIQPSNQLVAQVNLANSVLIKTTIPTCIVNTKDITVPLLNPSITTFRGIGSTFGNRSFQIGLTCSNGNIGSSTNAYVTFSDINQPGNTSSTLSLVSGTGTATGLGLQILNNGTPIAYGPDSSATGNTNQWKAANIAQGVSTYNIPLSVRYIQSGSTVTPGTVTGRATFTMSYQ